MDAPGERPPAPDRGSSSPERKGSARSRGEPGGAPGGSPPRSSQDTRRKRPAEGRYAGWGDGIDRVFCMRAERYLPAAFPVASHAGAATIAMSIVARRPDALLLCTFSHCGAHMWPDGEIVADLASENSGPTPGENP